MTVGAHDQDTCDIVVVGQTFAASRTPQRVAAMKTLGHSVRTIPTKPEGSDYETPPSLAERLRYRVRMPADPAGANEAIPAEAASADILWLETADMIRAATLRRLRNINPGVSIVFYSEDDMMNSKNRTIWLQQSMRLADLWATTKSLNVRPEERRILNVPNMLFVNNSYDPGIHRPVDLEQGDAEAYGAPVSFIGTYEAPRARSMLHLARGGLRVRIWGNGWEKLREGHPNLTVEGRPAYNDEFAKVVAASPVNLCFLRQANRDLQTCRSIELPACGAFMVHERNDEIGALLRESQDAVYFSDDDELLAVCRHWLDRADDRNILAANARRRVEQLQLSHRDNITRILDALGGTRMESGE